MLACKSATLSQPAVRELIALLKGTEFARAMKALPGYALDDPGELVAVKDVFPWTAPTANSP